jgi:hypothetical protein
MLRGEYHRQRIRAGLGSLVTGATIARCRLYRAKFKPGRKLTAYLDARVDGAGSRIHRHVAVTWTRPGDPEVGGRDDRGMQEEAIRAGVASPFHSLRGDIASAGIRLEVSPLDLDHPQLVRVSSPEHVREVLGHANRWGRGPIRITTIRYRPRQRHVLRYDPATPDGSADTLYGKLYRDGEARGAFALAATIADTLADLGSPVAAARPHVVVEEDDLVVYRTVPGTPVARRLAAGDDVGRELHTAGRALRLLQTIPPSEVGPIPTHSLEAEIASIARTSEHIDALMPPVADQIARILERAAALDDRLPAEEPAFAHGDYKCDHLFADHDAITLIDFNTCAVADPALDVGKFLADLDWWTSSSPSSATRSAKRAFLEGYGDMPSGRMLRACLYEVLVLTKITAHRVPLFDASWAADTRRLIGEASALLDRLEIDARGVVQRHGSAVATADRAEGDAG